jgi:hypothetical protein
LEEGGQLEDGRRLEDNFNRDSKVYCLENTDIAKTFSFCMRYAVVALTWFEIIVAS